MVDYPYEIKLENEGGEDYYILRYNAKELENVIGCGKTEEEALKTGEQALRCYLDCNEKRYVLCANVRGTLQYVSNIGRNYVSFAENMEEAHLFSLNDAKENIREIGRHFGDAWIVDTKFKDIKRKISVNYLSRKSHCKKEKEK